MVTVFDYTDFRLYLQDYFFERKRVNAHFSYQLLTEKAGFSNRGFIYGVIQGEKKLSKTHCFKLSKALGHSKSEAYYFENIVAYAQANSDEARTFFYEQALHTTKGTQTPAQLVRKDQYEYYSRWYHSAIRALIDLHPFEDDYVWLSKKLQPQITEAQAKKSIELLERLELIAKGEHGRYYITKKNLKAGDDISQLAKNRFNAEYTEIAKKSISEISPQSRSVVSLTLGISHATYQLICDETVQFKDRVIALATNDKKADLVYQLQLIVFPLTVE